MDSLGVKDRTVAVSVGSPSRLPHAPNPDAAIRSAHLAAAHSTQLLASYLMLALGSVLAAGLYRVIRRAEGKDGWLAIASLSAVGGAGIFGAGTALFMVVAYRPATHPAVARAFWDACWLAYNTAGFGFVAWIALVAAATLKHRVLPQWTAWVAAPIALISFAGNRREDRKRPRSLRRARSPSLSRSFSPHR